MEYGKIVSESFNLSRRYPSLWILGLFAGGANTYNLDFANGADFQETEVFGQTMMLPDMAIVAIFGFALAITLFMLFLGSICMPAVIDSANRTTRGSNFSFGASLSVGIDCLWRFFGLEIVYVVTGMVAMGGLVGLAVVAFWIHWSVGVLSILLALPVGFMLLVAILTVFSLAGRALVVRNGNMADSIEEGYELFRANLGPSFVMFLILFFASIGIAIVWWIAMLIVGAPIAAITLALGMGWGPTVFAGFIMTLPLSVLIGGFAGTWFTHLYTLFYFRLVEPAGHVTQSQNQSQNPTQQFGV